MEILPGTKEFLKTLIKIKCIKSECSNFSLDEDNWPICKLGDVTSPKNSYIQCFMGENICPFHEKI